MKRGEQRVTKKNRGQQRVKAVSLFLFFVLCVFVSGLKGNGKIFSFPLDKQWENVVYNKRVFFLRSYRA